MLSRVPRQAGNAKNTGVARRVTLLDELRHAVRPATRPCTSTSTLSFPEIVHLDCPHFYMNGRPGESEEKFATRLAVQVEQVILEEGRTRWLP